MATKKATTPDTGTPTIAGDLRSALGAVYETEAMLIGAAALLDAHYEGGNDRDLWAAQEIIKAAIPKIQGVHMVFADRNILKQVVALEGGAE